MPSSIRAFQLGAFQPNAFQMSSSWLGAKTILVALLDAIPGITKAYANPPASIQDVPCFIVYPPRVEVARGTARREKIYTIRCLLLLTEEKLEEAMGIVDEFRESVIDAIDGDVKLGDPPAVWVVINQVVEAAAAFSYGGKIYTGFDCILTCNVQEARTFTA